jgi:2-methylisocitrate lyase-like PEP mutase family enzyme
MNHTDKTRQFAELHVKGTPLVLYNAWDAGSAKAVLAAGAEAIATSSWAVAAAQGYADGEAIPIEFLHQIVGRITATVEVPVTTDFEGGYSDDDNTLAENIARLLETGIVGINFEDRVVKGEGLYGVDRQARRIAAIRRTAEQKGVRLFINARTDVFFEQGGVSVDAANEALDRAQAYAQAGASGLFTPGITDDALIGQICEKSALPVNVMVMDGVPSNRRLAELGVARISYGALPYQEAMKRLQEEAGKIPS